MSHEDEEAILREPDDKGRITIPLEMREEVDARLFRITQSEDGTITLSPAQVTA